MAVIVTNLSCELQRAVKVQYLDGNLISQDNQANRFDITVLDGGEPASISGSVTADVIRSDGGTVAVTGGTISGNVVSISFPAAVYAIPGVVSIVVKITASSVVTTIAAVVANVYRSTTDTVVDPGTIIPSIQTLISAIEAAVASIPADYSSLWTSLAPAFNPSRSGGYKAGEFCTNDGAVYICTVDHTGAWNSSHFAVTNLGDQLTSLKSAITSVENGLGTGSIEFYDKTKITENKYLAADGTETSANGWNITDYMPVSDNYQYYCYGQTSSSTVKTCFYDRTKTFISDSALRIYSKNYYQKLDIPQNAKYVRFSISSGIVDTFKYTLFIPTEATTVKKPNTNPDGTSGQFLKTNGDGTTTWANIEGIEKLELGLSNGSIEYYDKTKNTQGEYLKSDGTTTTYSGWNITDYLPVGDNYSYYCYGQVSSSSAKTCFYDSTKTFITDSGLRIYSQNYYQKLEIPQNAKYVRFSISDSIVNTFEYKLFIPTDSTTVKKPNTNPDGTSGQFLKTNGDGTTSWSNINAKSIWFNKTYISHGDSITWQDGKAYIQGEHQGETAVGYQTIFSEAVDLASYNNQGASGYPMAVVDNRGVVNVIMNIASYESYDLCTIACGTNDFKLDVPLGTLGQIGDTTFDDTKFYGAYRKAIEYILTSNPTIRIVLMTPLQRDNSGYNVNTVNGAGHKLIDYVNAVKAVGEMYGLPVCDMYANSGFTKKTLSTYTMDGLHPNDVGYQRMGGYLTQFLNAVGC